MNRFGCSDRHHMYVFGATEYALYIQHYLYKYVNMEYV